MAGFGMAGSCMRGRHKALWAIALSIAATLLSSAVGGQADAVHPEIMGCESGCVVAAGGWPVAYLVDIPAFSPVGSVSLFGALLGMDELRPGRLAATWLFWLASSALLTWLTWGRRWTKPAT